MTTYRVGQVADLLGVSTDTVRRWADSGRLLMRRRAGGQRMIDGADLARFLTETPHPSEPELNVAESARNRFPGIVTKVEKDGLVAVVQMQAGPHRVVSLMTREAADELGLEPGDVAVGVVKSTNVVVEVPRAEYPRIEPENVAKEQFVLKRMRWTTVLVVSIALAGVATAAPATAARAKKLSGSITVSAAASLTEAFTKMGSDFQKRNRGTTVTFNYGASSTLAQQIQGGAPADVFASADGTNMQKLVSGGQVTATPVDFASNVLTIVVKPGNPKNVKSLADLAKLDVVALCAPAVPCGKYAAQAESQLGITIPPEKTTLGADVKATLAAVATGDADAGVVYATDAKAAGKSVQEVKIPASQNVLAVYPIAPIASTQNASLANGWISYVTSRAGQRTLKSFGFLPPPPVE